MRATDPGADEVEELARRAAGGDDAALADLLVAIRPAVIERCARILDDRQDIEEAAQDALMGVTRRIGGFEGRSRFSTWLYSVATNAAIDTFRRRRRRAQEMSVGPETWDEQHSTARTSSVASSRIDLIAALGELDARIAQPVVLRDLQGLDYAEIAALLEIPVGTVKSRIHEGRRALQRRLGA